MFDLLILSAQRKFLSRKTCETAGDAARAVAVLLIQEVVGSVTIRRRVVKEPKPTKEPPAND